MSEIKSPKQLIKEMKAKGYRHVDYIVNEDDELIELVFISREEDYILEIKINTFTFEYKEYTRKIESNITMI